MSPLLMDDEVYVGQGAPAPRSDWSYDTPIDGYGGFGSADMYGDADSQRQEQQASQPEGSQEGSQDGSSSGPSGDGMSAVDGEEGAQPDVVKYYQSLYGTLKKGDDTAAGTTDDKTPDQPGQEQCVQALSTDARKIANKAFPHGKATIPAELLTFSDAYDVTQACSRIAKLYSLSRKDFYNQAAKDLEVRNDRLAFKLSIAEKLYAEVDGIRDMVTV